MQAFTVDQLHERYHQLVDKRLTETIHYTESLELDLIVARLEAEDHDELNLALALRTGWRQEREELLASIQQLLARLGASR